MRWESPPRFALLPSRRGEWSAEECALSAARKDSELLNLLSNDEKVFATLRRLGFSVGGNAQRLLLMLHGLELLELSVLNRTALLLNLA